MASYLLDNIYHGLSTKLYKQIAGTPMGTNCFPLVADLFVVVVVCVFFATKVIL